MQIEQINKTINQKIILKNISFPLKKGQISGLIGRNGTGKTTLLRTLANHYTKDTGNVTIGGLVMTDNLTLYERLFYLDSQYHCLANMTPKSIARYYQTIYTQFDEAKYFGLLEKYQLPSKGLYRTYSKGMQGLFNVILAFSTGADYLLFDEPFDGLDIIIKKQVLRLVINEVSSRQLAVLISSHNLAELENIVDNVLILKNKNIIKTYCLETIRESAVKVQMIFPTDDVPELITANCTVLQQQGRVITGLSQDLSPELISDINSLNPLLFEELPVLLEDLFASNLTDENDYHLYN